MVNGLDACAIATTAGVVTAVKNKVNAVFENSTHLSVAASLLWQSSTCCDSELYGVRSLKYSNTYYTSVIVTVEHLGTTVQLNKNGRLPGVMSIGVIDFPVPRPWVFNSRKNVYRPYPCDKAHGRRKIAPQ